MDFSLSHRSDFASKFNAQRLIWNNHENDMIYTQVLNLSGLEADWNKEEAYLKYWLLFPLDWLLKLKSKALLREKRDS